MRPVPRSCSPPRPSAAVGEEAAGAPRPDPVPGRGQQALRRPRAGAPGLAAPTSQPAGQDDNAPAPEAGADIASTPAEGAQAAPGPSYVRRAVAQSGRPPGPAEEATAAPAAPQQHRRRTLGDLEYLV